MGYGKWLKSMASFSIDTCFRLPQTHETTVPMLTTPQGLLTGRTKELVKWFDQTEDAETAFKVMVGLHASTSKWASVKKALSEPRTINTNHKRWLVWLEEQLSSIGAAEEWLEAVLTIIRQKQQWMSEV
jgi:hypothetical protein